MRDRSMTEGRSAGISVFLTIVYLTLVVFSCSLVEVTRLNIARIQAERALISASQSVLGGYDTYLKEHYGLFARNEGYGDVAYISDETPSSDLMIQQDLSYYVNRHIQNDPDEARQSLIDTYVFAKDQNPWNLTEVSLEGIAYNGTQMLYNPNKTTTKEQIGYVKNDMLGYMEVRAPALFLEGVADHFGAFEKVGKTGAFIQEKNACIEKAGDIQSQYQSLYTLIEGIAINENDGSITVLDQPYVKRLVGQPITESCYPDGYLGDKTATLINQLTPMADLLNAYTVNFNVVNSGATQVKESYEHYMLLADAIKVLEAEKIPIEEERSALLKEGTAIEALLIEAEKHNPEAVRSYEDDLFELSKQITVLSHELNLKDEAINQKAEEQEALCQLLRGVLNGMESAYSKNVFILETVQLLTNDDLYNVNHLSYLNLNAKARTTIEAIESEIADFSNQVDGFIADHEKDKNAVIGDTYNQAIIELENLRKGFSKEGAVNPNYSIQDNLTLMRETATQNEVLLEALVPTVATFIDEQDGAYYALYEEKGMDVNALYDVQMVMLNETYGCLNVGLLGVPANYSRHLEAVESIKTGINGYNNTLFVFDYNGYLSYDPSAYEENVNLLDGLKGIMASLDFNKVVEGALTLNKGSLTPFAEAPSKQMNGSTGTDTAMVPNLDYEDPSAREESFSDSTSMEAITGFATGVKEQFLLNEYTLGMFKSFVDGDDDLTFSRYPKAEHKMNTEVEYILTGIENSDEALLNVTLKILAIRVICNAIYLMVDSGKRTMIINAANAIAGWWSFGLAAIIFIIVITLLWATAESVVDITTLIFEKEKVPLIKMNGTWKTDLQGLARDGINAITNVAISAATDAIETMSDELIDQVEEGLTAFGDTVTDEIKESYNKEVNRLYNEGKQQAEGAVKALESQVYGAIDGYLYAMNKGIADTFVLSDYIEMNSPAYALVSEMIEALSESITQETLYSAVVAKRKEIFETYEAKLSALKDTLLEQMDSAVETTVSEFVTEVKTMASDQIKGISGAAIDQLSQKKSGDMSVDIAGKAGMDTKGQTATGKSSALAAFIPSLSYNDYLRLFMWLNYNDLDQRIMRMLDVIELNTAYHYYENAGVPLETLLLEDYMVSFEAKATYKIERGMFIAPFLPYINQDVGSDMTFSVTVVNGYE